MTLSWIDLANFAFPVVGLTVVLMGLLMNTSAGYMQWESKRFFRLLFSLMTVYIVSDLLELTFMQLGPGYAVFSRWALFFESFFSSLLMPLLTLFLLRCCRMGWRASRLVKIVAALWLVYFCVLVAAQFTTAIYYYTDDNVYHRGPWYPLLLIPPVLLMAVNLLALYRLRDRLSPWQRTAFSVYLIVPLVAMLIQMCVYGLLTIVIATALSSMVMFLAFYREQVELYIKTQEENARQRASIMVLQMRPHFIYNTMLSIYYLCQEDAEKAQRVILDFTAYLRRNFTALAQTETIPFTEELEHTRAYLAVEQVRFENRLFVEFDTPHVLFRVPPLTLQPIVENAVKHGVDPELEPLYISIRAYETPEGSEITVEDSGPGFGPADDREPHIALENIRRRLELHCRGTLLIAPRPGGGTAVTITVPNKT